MAVNLKRVVDVGVSGDGLVLVRSDVYIASIVRSKVTAAVDAPAGVFTP